MKKKIVKESQEKVVEVKNLVKFFNVPDKEFMEKAGFFKKLFYRKYVKKEVLKGISFNIEKGEIVGYLGRNGAGKTTTIKILSGILQQDSGEVRVCGKIPYKERKNLGKEISVVFGNRNNVFIEIPLIDSVKFYARVYGLDKEESIERTYQLAKMLEMEDLLEMPVRKMSFGQIRKANILVSFLHSPRIVFLDEPTIGLDIFAKEKVREFLKKMNEKEGTAIMITSHYLEDIERLANRIILLDDGRIIEDASYHEIIRKIEYKIVNLYGERNTIKRILLSLNNGKILNEKKEIVQIVIPKEEIIKIIDAYQKGEVEDIEIRNPSLEDVLKEVYYD